MRVGVVLLVAVVGCGRPKQAPPELAPPPPDPLSRPLDAWVEPPPPPPHAEPTPCQGDEAFRRACAARGTTFRVTGDPMFGCSGAELTEKQLRGIEEARRRQPCLCLEQRELDERAFGCGQLP